MRTMTTSLAFAFVLAGTLAAQQPGATAPAQGRGQRAPDPRSAGGGQCSENPYNCIDTPNPLTPPDTVWLEEMTWMDVRDAMKAGKTTVIISTGGIEPNGPWLALGKHNYVLKANCDAIARKLGNALCAPIVPFVPEGSLDPKSGHMTTVGTISMREETFQALLTDIVHSFKVHGFQNIILIGDSGGNVTGMKTVAEKLNAQWNGSPVVAHIPEYYDYNSVAKLLDEIGVTKAGQKGDNLHDDPGHHDEHDGHRPEVACAGKQRVKAGKATINGVSIADKAKALEIGRKIVDMRATQHRRRHQEGDREQGKVDDAAVRALRDRRRRSSCCWPASPPDTPDPEGWSRFRGPNGSGVSTSTRLPAEFGPDHERRLEDRAAVRPLVAGADARAHFPDRRARRAPGDHLPRSAEPAGSSGSATRRDRASEKLDSQERPGRADAGDRRHQRLRVLRRFRAAVLRHERTRAVARAARPVQQPLRHGRVAGARRRCGRARRAIRTPTRSSSSVAQRDGRVRWKTPRPEAHSGHSTPILYKPAGGATQIIVPGSFLLTAYAPGSGEKLWWVGGLSFEMKSTPVVSGDTLFINGFGTPQNQPGAHPVDPGVRRDRPAVRGRGGQGDVQDAAGRQRALVDRPRRRTPRCRPANGTTTARRWRARTACSRSASADAAT